MQKFGPVRPNVIAMWPAAAFAISIGTMNGDTRPGPFSFSTSCWIRSVSIPPIPVAKTTPPRSEGTSGLAGVLPGELRRGDRELREAVGPAGLLRVEPVARDRSRGPRPATVTGRSSVGNRVISRTPLRPVVSPFQKSSTPVPTGVTGPIPVMTTLRGRVGMVPGIRS